MTIYVNTGQVPAAVTSGAAAGATALQPANNLSEVTAPTARTNLGLGSAAVAALDTASGAAKVGSDGYVGGAAGTPLAPLVVTGTSNPAGAGYVAKTTGSTSGSSKFVPDVVVDAHRYGKGDGTQDELANLQAAIAEVQARGGGVGGAIGAINLGVGIWKLSGKLVLPSNIGLISTNKFGRVSPGTQLQPWTDFGDYLLATATLATGCFIHDIGVYINNAFSTVSGIDWQCSQGRVTRCSSRNSYLQGFNLFGSANHISDCYLEGFANVPRGLAPPTLATYTGGGLHMSGVDNWIIDCEISGGANHAGGFKGVLTNTSPIVTGITAGAAPIIGAKLVASVGGITAGTTVLDYNGAASQALATSVTMSANATSTQASQVITHDKGNLVRTSQLYHCATCVVNGSGNRWHGNVHENGDVSCYIGIGAHNIFDGERFEWSNGHGLWETSGSFLNVFTKSYFTENGLGQKDTYHHHLEQGNRNTFTQSTFYWQPNVQQAGTQVPATCVVDLVVGTANAYSNCYADAGSYVSAPFVCAATYLGNRSDVRAGFPQFTNFAVAPLGSHIFNWGDVWRVGAPTPGGNLWLTNTGFPASATATPAAGAAITGATTIGSNQVTVTDGTQVPWGAYVSVTGAIAAGQVTGKNGNVITLTLLGGLLPANATATVSAGAVVGATLTSAPVGTIQQKVIQAFSGLAAIAAGAQLTVGTVTLGNSIVQNRVDATWTSNLLGLRLWGEVTSAGTVTLFMSNNTGASVTPPNGTASVWVRS